MVMMAGVVMTAASIVAYAQDVYQWLPSPYNAAPSAIEDQQQYNQPTQRLSPRNRAFLSRDTGQPPSYDATTINRYLMGSPNTNYRVRPLYRQPNYGAP